MNADQQARLDRMLAKDEIKEVLTRLARGTDRCDLMLIQSCYHDDAYDDHGGYQGDAGGFVDWLKPTVMDAFSCTMHKLGNVLIEVDGEQAFAQKPAPHLLLVR